MQLLTRNDIVLYAANIISGEPTNRNIDGVMVTDTADCNLVSNVNNVPADFVGYKYLYTVGAFTLNPDYVAPVIPSIPTETLITRYEFRSLFTFDEMVAITTAAKTDVVIEVFQKSMEVAEEIDLTSDWVTKGLGYLVANEYITQEKMDNILAEVLNG